LLFLPYLIEPQRNIHLAGGHLRRIHLIIKCKASPNVCGEVNRHQVHAQLFCLSTASASDLHACLDAELLSQC